MENQVKMANSGIPGENTGFITGQDRPSEHKRDHSTGHKTKWIVGIFLIVAVFLGISSVIVALFWKTRDFECKSASLEDVLNNLEDGLLHNVHALNKTLNDENEFNELYKKYKEIFDKTYPDTKDLTRETIFKTNLLKVAEHNTRFLENKITYTMEVNLFTDMEITEVVRHFSGLQPPETNNSTSILKRQKRSILDDKQAPKTRDWRDYGFYTSVKNQGGCPSCVFFATAACFELYYAYTYNETPVNLSAEELLCCAREELSPMYNGNKGCLGKGNDFAETFEYIKEKGLSLEKDYRYRGEDGDCGKSPPTCQPPQDPKKRLQDTSLLNQESEEKRFKLVKYGGNEDELKKTIGLNGPVVVRIEWTWNLTSFGDDYGSRTNIYSEPCTEETRIGYHAVLAVGYGTEDGTDYWLLKNSYGYEWGNKGYFKIKRNKNLCGIATDVYECVADQIDTNKIKAYQPSLDETIENMKKEVKLTFRYTKKQFQALKNFFRSGDK